MRVCAVGRDDEVVASTRPVVEPDVDSVPGLRNRLGSEPEPYRCAVRLDPCGEHPVEGWPRHCERRRVLGPRDSRRARDVEDIAADVHEGDVVNREAGFDARVEDTDRAERSEGRPLQEQPDPERRPVPVDLDELRPKALGTERDRCGHPRRPAADDEDALDPAHAAASSPPSSAAAFPPATASRSSPGRFSAPRTKAM